MLLKGKEIRRENRTKVEIVKHELNLTKHKKSDEKIVQARKSQCKRRRRERDEQLLEPFCAHRRNFH